MTNADDINNLGLTASTKRLMAKLASRGVVFLDTGSAYIIYSDKAQARMNSRAGEAAPTWYLHHEVGHHALMSGESWVSSWGKAAPVEFQGKRLRGVASYLPLTWILKHPVDEWDLYEHDLNHYLWVEVAELPPSWF